MPVTRPLPRKTTLTARTSSLKTSLASAMLPSEKSGRNALTMYVPRGILSNRKAPLASVTALRLRGPSRNTRRLVTGVVPLASKTRPASVARASRFS